MAKITDTVKWFNETKGFGFITPEDRGKDVFVNYTAIDVNGFKTLTVGQKVEFDIQEGSKVSAANNVMII
ncbi:MAG TPA: cold shock domain-containing protein [Arsenophonus sp.]